MKENVETKDVQRTEYLDKNGLDMLWTKVKENTHNQVEVERNRATTQENRIIETKADKSELHSNYVSNSTFIALQEKVSANTDAISNKQDAGNYLRYNTLNNEGYYEIPDIRIPDSGGINKTDIDSQSISINCSNTGSHTTITCDGISNTDNNANHVYATDGSIADLTLYAKKSEITAGGNVDDVQVNGVSVVENKIANIKPATKESLGVVKVGDGLNVIDGTISVDSTAIGAGNYIPYARYENDEYIMLNNICVEGARTKSRISSNGLSVYKMTNQGIHSNIQCAEIELQSDKNRVRINDDGIDIWKLDVHADHGISDHLLCLSNRGIALHGGDNNHVLTSNASTIDITQYVLKSVYDEKIAALEARIAALEAKHIETA